MNVHISKISQTSSSGEGHLSNNWANSELTNYFFLGELEQLANFSSQLTNVIYNLANIKVNFANQSIRDFGGRGFEVQR